MHYVSNALSSWNGFDRKHIVRGMRVKINSLNAVINPIFPLRRLFGAHYIFQVAG